MSIDDKKKTLVKWLYAFGIHYATMFTFGNGFCTFDFLNEDKTSYAGLCLGGVNQVVIFPYSYDEAAKWFPCIAIDDERAINFIVHFLDAQPWHFKNGYVFFCGGPFKGRIAIDLAGFSWETLAVNYDLHFPEEA